MWPPPISHTRTQRLLLATWQFLPTTLAGASASAGVLAVRARRHTTQRIWLSTLAAGLMTAGGWARLYQRVPASSRSPLSVP
jgi:hypothetical protein